MQSRWISPLQVHSNSKKLLLSIPGSQRKIGVKDQDLSGQLLNEKALGICWEIGEDAFTFKIKLDERALTKRVMVPVISSIYCCTILYWREEGFFKAFVSRMCSGMLRFAMMCSKAGINGKGTWSSLNNRMCKGASNLLILVTFHQLVFIIFLIHLNLVMGNATTLGWLARKAKFILFAAWKGKSYTKEVCFHSQVGANSCYLVSKGGKFA